MTDAESSVSEPVSRDAERSEEHVRCMEIRGGFRAIDEVYQTTGMRIWIYSRPQQQDKTGGDVYYVSSCASGRITRVLLADISGHGAGLSPVSESLRSLMRKNINRISSGKLVAQLNRDFEAVDEQGYFATGLVSTYFCPTRKMTLNNAGHPAPLLKTTGSPEWEIQRRESQRKSGELLNLPLGVNEQTRYESQEIPLAVGDLLLLYTDGVIEVPNSDGKMLGVDGLRDLVNSLDTDRPQTLITELLQKLERLADGPLTHDDITIILCQIQPARYSFSKNLMAPFRLLGSVLAGR